MNHSTSRHLDFNKYCENCKRNQICKLHDCDIQEDYKACLDYQENDFFNSEELDV